MAVVQSPAEVKAKVALILRDEEAHGAALTRALLSTRNPGA